MEIIFDHTLSTSEMNQLIKDMYIHFGKDVVEFLRFPIYWKSLPKDMIEFEGLKHLENARRKNKGFLLISAHLGMWEFLILGFNQLGIDGAVIVKSIRNKKLNQLILNYRTGGSIIPIENKRSTQKIIKLIKKQNGIGFILDQNMNEDFGVFVDFGSEKAGTLTAPALLASRYQVPVIPCFMIRKQDGNYKLYFLPEIILKNSNDLKESMLLNTQHFTDIIRENILKYPDQWIWMHKRFRSRPEEMPSVY